MGVSTKVKSAVDTAKKAASSVLGTFTGKCCDSNVFNKALFM